MWCIVNLPNGTQQAVKWDAKSIGQECLEKLCKALGICCEMEYFGLEHWTPNQPETRTRQWINLRNRLTCDSGSSCIHLMLALRIKFWVPVHFILQEQVRNIFYMQAKSDLLEGRLNALDWPNAAKLAALLCQADGVPFNASALKSKCSMHQINRQSSMEAKEKQAQSQTTATTTFATAATTTKDKEHALSFKKRRLSKQKSIENIHHTTHHGSILVAAQSHSLDIDISNSTYSSLNNSHEMPSTSTAAAAAAAIAITSSSSSTSSSLLSSQSINAKEIATTTTTTTSNTGDLNANSSEDGDFLNSPLRVYYDYIIHPDSELDSAEIPDDFLHQIAIEHSKLVTLRMTEKSAKYWLLQEIQDLPGYGEEVFNGVSMGENSTHCDIAVGASGITVTTGYEKKNIPFTAIAAAKSDRRTFKLEYLNDHSERCDLEVKFPKHAIAAGLYRSITERHAFYVCDKVRGVVTNQFTRDLKGTIASMFKEDTELGKRYVFDIQHTCREVYDHARRILHERGIQITSHTSGAGVDFMHKTTSSKLSPSSSSSPASPITTPRRFNEADSGDATSCTGLTKLDMMLREQDEREQAIERSVELRINEAMTCKICMDRPIDTMFNPCCHVMACMQCATRCTNCPNCRVKITSAVKIYLPPELRTNPSDACNSNSSNEVAFNTPKITAAA